MKISIDLSQSGLTVYAVIRQDGTAYNGVSFETFASGNWSTYANSCTEQSTTGHYDFTFPSGITDGDYAVAFYQQDGASPAIGDVPVGAKTVTIEPTTSSATATGNTAAAYTNQLNAIDAQINNLINNPRPNYRVGNTQMDYGNLLETLYKIREKILQKLQSLQSESFETLNTDVNVFGQDIADYINEETT